MNKEQREKLKESIALMIDEHVADVTSLEGVSFVDHVLSKQIAEKILQEVEKVQ